MRIDEINPHTEILQMFLITKDVKNSHVNVFAIETAPTDVDALVNSFSGDRMGWIVQSHEDLRDTGLTGKDMLGIYNAGAASPLVKFASKKDGATRTFDILDRVAKDLDVVDIGEPSNKDPYPAPAAKKRGTGKRGKSGIHQKDPAFDLKQCKAGTKQARLLDALTIGATKDELLHATRSQNENEKDWQWTSITSAFHYDLYGKGYGITTDEKEDGNHVYRIVLPNGYDAPLGHK